LTPYKHMNPISVRHTIHNRIFYFCSIALMFLIPVYGKLLPPVISLMVLNWLIDGTFLKKIPLVIKEARRWQVLLFTSIYVIYLAGLINTSNFHFGFFDLQIKLSLLIFPLVFSTLDADLLDKAKLTILLKVYLAGCFAGSLILLFHSFFVEMNYGVRDSFVYSNLSWSFHPSYFAMYLSFAIAIIAELLYFNDEEFKWKGKLMLVLLVLYFFVIIFLLSSRAGIVSLLIIVILYVLLLVSRKGMIKPGLVLILVSALCFYGAFNLFPYAKSRIARTGDSTLLKEQVGSTAERLSVWRTAVPIIKQNFLFGVGTGDVKDELLKSYREQNLQVILMHELNAHNQFIQTFIALGFIGFLVLILNFILPGIGALRSKHFLYFVFLIIFCFNNLVESMLETQAGVVFYAFINTLFFWTSRDENNARGKSLPNSDAEPN
jgi:O-antigen ligase